MKAELTSLDIYWLREELKTLENSRLDKLFISQNHFVISFYVFGKGKKFLHLILPSTIYLSEQKSISGEDTGLSKILRKYLINKKLKSIDQHEFERILILDFDDVKVIIELFDKGNFLLLKKDNTIISGKFFKKFRERTIRGGIIYEFPKNKINPLNIEEREFENEIQKIDEGIVKILAKKFSLGGEYSEDICKKAGIDKNSKSLSKKQINELFKVMKDFFNNSPIGKNQTLSSTIEKVVKTEPPDKKENKNIKKIEVIIKKQKELLESSIKGYEENNLKGSKIYEHFQEIDLLLKKANELKKKEGWESLKEKLESKKVKIDKNTGKITVDLK